MRRGALVCVLCLVVSVFPLAPIAPTVSAQGAGWGTAELIETGVGNADDQRVAVDPGGNATAVWSDDDGLFSHIWASRYAVGIGWTVPVLLETNGTEDAWSPQVAVDSSGNAVAVWIQPDGVRTNVWASRYVFGFGWLAPELIEAGSENAGGVQVAVDPSGNAVAVWLQSDGVRDHVWANRYAVGAGWGMAETIEANVTFDARYPDVAVDPSGNAVAVWLLSEGPLRHVRSNRYVVGVGWGADDPIEMNSTADTEYPQVAVGSSGDAMAVWGQYDGSRRDVWANRYVVGAGWGAPELIETDAVSDTKLPQVAVDSSGNAIAVWGHIEGSRWVIRANRYVVGTGWGTPTRIDTSATYCGPPELDVDPKGNAVAVWYEMVGALRGDIWANEYVVGIGWRTPELLETNETEPAYFPRVAVDASGDAVVVWRQRDVTDFHIWANRYEAPDLLPPVADAGPDQTVLAGDLVTFDGSGSTDNVGLANYTWTFSDGGPRTLWGVSPSYTFSSVGAFTITLTVEDAAVLSDTDAVVITVNPVPDAEDPVADAGPDQSILVGSTTVLDGSGSSDNVGIVDYAWTFTYNGSSRSLHGQLVAFKFDVVGDYTVNLTVRDAAGNTGNDTVVVSVTAVPGGGTTEVVPLWAIAAIVLLAVLAVAFALLFLLARRKKGAGPAEEKATSEKEGLMEERRA